MIMDSDESFYRSPITVTKKGGNTVIIDINSLSKYVDLTRPEVRSLTLSQKVEIANRNFVLARELGVSLDDYQRGIKCRNI